jgi:membrane associated rhomboid family serine protease
MIRLTPVVKNLLIINILFFIAQKVIGPMLSIQDFASCLGFDAGLRLDVFTGYLAMWHVGTSCFKPYQLFTYMFLHADLWHIFMNMLLLVFFGPILESLWGDKKFLLFYMITGIGAGIFNIAMNFAMGAGMYTYMLGASGAVYGVLTAFGITFPNMELRLLFLPISFKAKYLVIVSGMLAIISGFNARPGDNVAHFAHLGGIVVAILMISYWRKRGE